MSQSVLIAHALTSPLHLINFLTYLHSTKVKYDRKYICIQEYWGKPTIPSRYLEYCSNNGITILTPEQYKRVTSLITKEDEITLVFVKSLSLKALSKLLLNNINKIVIIDEGLSSYAGSLHSIKALVREKGALCAGTSILSIILKTPYVLAFRNKLLKFSAFESDLQEINKEYCSNFKAVLDSLHLNDNKATYEDKKYSNYFLFCSQPWVDIGLMTCSEYTEILNDIQQKIKKIGKDLIIKKHPADFAYDYDNFETIDFNGSAEELIWTHKFAGIVSRSSTTSILVSACFGYKSYLLDFNELSQMDHKLNRLFRRYCTDFSSVY